MVLPNLSKSLYVLRESSMQAVVHRNLRIYYSGSLLTAIIGFFLVSHNINKLAVTNALTNVLPPEPVI